MRPDFAALIDGRPCGWVELKAPGHTVIGEKWRGREKGQWDLLSQLDALLVSNGDEIALYVSGSLGTPRSCPSTASQAGTRTACAPSWNSSPWPSPGRSPE
ncbi:hypothetical protein GS507_26435 [Rhodococcus hoagii]|nr:hypothetical protein [Prescottella equi]